MSYLVKQRRYRGQPKAMDGFTDFINTIADQIWQKSGRPPTEVQACLTAANAQTAQLDAKTRDLNLNWKPTGFYSPTQVQQLVAGVADVLNRSNAALQKSLSGAISDERDALKEFITRNNKQIAASQPYLAAARQVSSSGAAAVNAPGLKNWVIKAMIDASSGIDAAYVMVCLEPWWIDVARAFVVAFNALWSLAKGIVGVVVDVGAAVVKVASNLDTIWTIAKWGGLAMAAAFVIREVQRQKGSGA